MRSEAPTEAMTTAGDHRHAVVLDPRDVIAAEIADICADADRRL